MVQHTCCTAEVDNNTLNQLYSNKILKNVLKQFHSIRILKEKNYANLFNCRKIFNKMQYSFERKLFKNQN